MKQDLLKLVKLQRVDSSIHEKERQAADLRTSLSEMEQAYKGLESELHRQQAELAEIEKLRREHESDLKAGEEVTNRSKSRLAAVKNTKEYMAVQRELETARKNVSQREEEVLRLMELEKTARENVREHEEKLGEVANQVKTSLEDGNRRIAEMEEGTGSLREEHDRIAAQVPRSLLRKYDSIRARRDGLAVVPVSGGICQGCNIGIPPQLYNILHRADGVEICPSCNRIIYWQGLVDEGELGESQQPSSGESSS